MQTGTCSWTASVSSSLPSLKENLSGMQRTIGLIPCASALYAHAAASSRDEKDRIEAEVGLLIKACTQQIEQ
eukprot:scaffold322122_cov19-Tisochrysis_lutea.AAC.2